MTTSPVVKAFFDTDSNTISYVVSDPATAKAAIIDSVLDFNYASGTISYDHANEIIAYIKAEALETEWLIETHVHADHLSAAPYLQDKLGGKIGISEKITEIQTIFGKVFNAGTKFERDGSQFDRLFSDGDEYKIGTLHANVIATPGHTPACMAHIIGDAIFVGDTMFMPDGGTARADFPGGDARTLYQSIKKLLALPAEMRMFICHDYGPNGRDIKWQTSVAEQRQNNIHVRDGISEDEFVEMRETRDATLNMPRLIMPSIQVNMRAGYFPEAENNGETYIKVPIQGLKS
ncbi:MAG TPA: MBL fold metallo-hydrolase [Alphaproteobacteria bacterium]|nr:MBL fold metallo-hydrolase [Alphaproteobacteria bacterium]